jgi:hypothetical protein
MTVTSTSLLPQCVLVDALLGSVACERRYFRNVLDLAQLSTPKMTRSP